jgi:hypothetical protein
MKGIMPTPTCGSSRRDRNREIARWTLWRSFAALLASALCLSAALPGQNPPSAWPQTYSVQRDEVAGLLTLTTPYYQLQHDLKRGGIIARIKLAYGEATNLLVQPLETRLRDEKETLFTDLCDPAAHVSHHRDGLMEIVTVECGLLDARGQAAGVRLRTVYEYHWGHVTIHKEFIPPAAAFRARELCPLVTTLSPTLTDYGYREGVTEQEGAPPFSFGSCRWGRLSMGNAPDPLLKTSHLPRYMLFARAGVEGIEWFMGSDLSQWETQLTGRRGQGQCLLEPSAARAGFGLTLAAFHGGEAPITLTNTCSFDYHLGLPILEGHARKPWLHTSFNRNRGEWVTPDQVRRWAETGLQTVHCHNDGDYYNDGLFWRDGAYPPYPDMAKFDQIIQQCHQAGLRVATYFSNKELHPSTQAFQEHGSEWGRRDSKGALQHNFFRDKSEFGVQMCLRSGWLDFLKASIDRVLTNHPLDGVYYDWNVALLCCNSRHEGKPAGPMVSAHWDIDELLNLMEWTRRRVGPNGLVIVHNTTTPMYATENFADFVVANEWGYGKWSENGPELRELPLEWSLVGARSRGVISYGQIDSQASRRLHRLFALEALLGGVTPWPASPETLEVFSILKAIGQIETCRFADWRNQAVDLKGPRCASAIYSRPGEAFILLCNLDKSPQEVHFVVHPDRLPYPLASPGAAVVLGGSPNNPAPTFDGRQLVDSGIQIPLPADGAILIRVR